MKKPNYWLWTYKHPTQAFAFETLIVISIASLAIVEITK